VVTFRTPDERLIWLAAIGSRSKDDLAGLGVLAGWRGIFVREVKAAYGSTLVISPDAGFLADPAVTYPAGVSRIAAVANRQASSVSPTLARAQA
jgi:hypothetical protein